MKRLIFLTAIYLAAATGLTLQAGNNSPKFSSNPDDTITIKLPDGVDMQVIVKSTDQLKNLKNYKLDSLMSLLGNYVEQVEQMDKTNQGKESKEITMTFNPSKDLKDPQAPEQVSITISGTSEDNSSGKKMEKVLKVFVDVQEGEKHTQDSVEVKKKSKKGRSNFSFDIDLGLNTFAKVPDNSGDAFDLKPMGSRYISLNQHFDARIGGQKSPLYLVTGFELAFNNFMLDKNRYLADEDGQTMFLKEPADGRSFEKSKLTTSSLNVPLMAALKFKNSKGKQSFSIGAGGFAGYRLGGHTKLKYQDEGKTIKDKERGSYNMEDFQYGLNFVIGYRGVELFGKYNLNELFKDNRGPSMNVLSFGFRI
ncbi:MAG: outer membrane beta-barrel protein [Adhaeribacter sp.]